MNDDEKNTIQRWLIKAENDLLIARAALSLENPVTDSACFHAQQCAEKCLKAYLVYMNQHIAKTHDLSRIVELCERIDPDFSVIYDAAEELSDYAVETRYPDEWHEISLEEANEAVQQAEKIKMFTKGKIKLDL